MPSYKIINALRALNELKDLSRFSNRLPTVEEFRDLADLFKEKDEDLSASAMIANENLTKIREILENAKRNKNVKQMSQGETHST